MLAFYSASSAIPDEHIAEDANYANCANVPKSANTVFSIIQESQKNTLLY